MTISGTAWPRTRSSLAADLRRLGVRPGSTLLVHSALRPLGWVCGGPHAVVLALRDALGPDGTLVVPTHTPENTDPATWRNPPVPREWWPVIRDEMPGFDAAATPSRWMGVIAEAVRAWPGARRSDHPQVSFAAVGPRAEQVVGGHARADMLGERSPLARLYELDADVLLLGVGHDSNTSLHLAEYRRPDPPRERVGAAVRTADDGREWVWWEDVALDESDFDLLGEDLDTAGLVRAGEVGSAQCRLMRQRDAVDFAVRWLAANR
ncbi:aminoglycoside 3-N-acetyltransferase [Micromonospora pattaloongensis]|uniref:Aminoglycoside N(3)-acetyltransferase n=1 Tax=Micromonospora pattaloongensis TaxID=405436 RepID=A0A1H3RLQ4_9ACTN|nr:AAC(3) family N-acetyltransferase [Micromonospora pattaloongensis]SDZ25849.1 aminoglycoside 3-N-acetyltransferase [Micromonospora pattaloongensis]